MLAHTRTTTSGGVSLIELVLALVPHPDLLPILIHDNKHAYVAYNDGICNVFPYSVAPSDTVSGIFTMWLKMK